jgi:hypothetical protein
MLYLLYKLVIALITIAGMPTLVSHTATASTFALFLILLLFLGSALLGFIASRAIYGFTIGHLATIIGVFLKVLHVYLKHLFPLASKGSCAPHSATVTIWCSLMELILRSLGFLFLTLLVRISLLGNLKPLDRLTWLIVLPCEVLHFIMDNLLLLVQEVDGLVDMRVDHCWLVHELLFLGILHGVHLLELLVFLSQDHVLLHNLAILLRCHGHLVLIDDLLSILCLLAFCL